MLLVRGEDGRIGRGAAVNAMGGCCHGNRIHGYGWLGVVLFGTGTFQAQLRERVCE